MGFNIGKTTLVHGLMLAPMAGVTDKIFRRMCMEHGAEYTISEMVSAKALCYEQMSKRKDAPSATSELAAVFDEDCPMAVQIFGSEPEFMAQAAKMLQDNSYKGCLSNAYPAAIDINMGCPVRKITSNGEGSALMKNVRLAGEIVEAVCKSVSIPVTVKIRSGWDADSINAVEMARVLESAGASAICVHARTREQLYTPGIDLDVIANVKSAVKIPVIGNGDVTSAESAIAMIEQTGCDGIMVGRGAMGNPWIFEEVKGALEGKNFCPPTLEERFDTALLQLSKMIECYGERNGLAQSKKHLAWYIFGLKGSASARDKIMTATSQEQIKDIFLRLIEMQD